MHLKRKFKFIALLHLCTRVYSVLSNGRPVIKSTDDTTRPGSNLVNNSIFGISSGTLSEASPWMNIYLSESARIRTVVMVIQAQSANIFASTSIRVGKDVDPRNNAICLSNINQDGVYVCPTTLTGNFVGVERTGQINQFYIREIWAYSWVPFDENNSILSADEMQNLTLNQSVHLVSSPLNTFGITANTLFVTGPAMNCFWKMDLLSLKHVKGVLIIGDVLDLFTSQTTLADWKLTVGNNPDPLQNQIFFTQMGLMSEGAKEFIVNAWGQYVAIIKTSAITALKLGYVGVFATDYDCNLTNTVSVASLPEIIFVLSTHTFQVTNSLNSSCIESVTVIQQGFAGLPTFMNFSSATNSLTVTPALTDFGNFNLLFTVKTFYDGLAASQTRTIEKVLTIYKTEIGSGAIANLTYQMGTPLTLAFPTIVTNPTGNVTIISWSAYSQPAWLSVSNSITINSSDPTLVGQTNAVTITATD